MKIPSRLQKFTIEIKVIVECPACGERHCAVDDESNWTKALQETEDAIKRHRCLVSEDATW